MKLKLSRALLLGLGAVALAFTLRADADTFALQQTRARNSTPVYAIASGVREIDVNGLKKLLERTQTSTRQARPLLVNFWATWCEPCREEFPDLVSINKDYAPRGLDFIVVSLDDVEELNKGVPQFLRQMRATMPAFLLNAPDPEAAMNAIDPAWSGALPATFLLNQKGEIVFKHMGRVKPAELRAAIDKTIKGDMQETKVGRHENR